MESIDDGVTVLNVLVGATLGWRRRAWHAWTPPPYAPQAFTTFFGLIKSRCQLGFSFTLFNLCFGDTESPFFFLLLLLLVLAFSRGGMKRWQLIKVISNCSEEKKSELHPRCHRDHVCDSNLCVRAQLRDICLKKNFISEVLCHLLCNTPLYVITKWIRYFIIFVCNNILSCTHTGRQTPGLLKWLPEPPDRPSVTRSR